MSYFDEIRLSMTKNPKDLDLVRITDSNEINEKEKLLSLKRIDSNELFTDTSNINWDKLSTPQQFILEANHGEEFLVIKSVPNYYVVAIDTHEIEAILEETNIEKHHLKNVLKSMHHIKTDILNRILNLVDKI